MITDRLILSSPVPSDFQSYFQIYSDPQTNLFNPMGPMSYDVAQTVFKETLAHWDANGFGIWAVRTVDNKEIIGFGGLAYRKYGDELKLNLGYRFAVSSWGRGYATELAIAAIRFGFDDLHVDRIYALVRPKHAVSIKVLEKAGMILSGTLNDVPDKEPSLVFKVEAVEYSDLKALERS